MSKEEKLPVYQVEVIASVDGGNSYRPIDVLTLEEPYIPHSGKEPAIVGYINKAEEES